MNFFNVVLRRPALATVFSLAIAIGVTSFGSLQAVADGHGKHIMHGTLKIEQPWTRATPGGAKMGGGYLTVTNMGDAADRLVSGTADFTGMIEIHTMGMDDGVMKMRELEDGLEIPAGETVALKPGGFHLMFMGLKAPLVKGEMVKVTLEFEKAGSIELMMPVAAIGSKTPGTPKAPDDKADHGGHSEHSNHSH